VFSNDTVNLIQFTYKCENKHTPNLFILWKSHGWTDSRM